VSWGIEERTTFKEKVEIISLIFEILLCEAHTKRA
jgi:hypothetical protein